MIYLDHAASTPIYGEVLELLSASFSADFANPSSAHLLGRKLQDKIKDCKKVFIRELGGHSQDQFIFTSSATESNNFLIKGLLFRPGDIILYSKADHKSLVAPLLELAQQGHDLRAVPHRPDGLIDWDLFFTEAKKSALDFSKITLVALSLVNNQSGVSYQLRDVLKILQLRCPRLHVHLDVVQAVGKVEFLSMVPFINSMTLASHKIGGPKGIAGLYLKNKTKVAPLIIGGDQQAGLRSGTECYPLISAFTFAFQMTLQKFSSEYERIVKLNFKLRKYLKEKVNHCEFPFESASPFILTFILPGIPSDVILRHLEEKEIYLSSTSACSSRIKNENAIFLALQIPVKWHKNVLRLSMSYQTTEEEIDHFLIQFDELWNQLQFLRKN